jgi:hypothetical protein
MEQLKNPIIAILFMTILSGLILFFLRDYGIAGILVITVLAFLASDILSLLFVRGGSGILQIPLFGTKAQPRGYGFLAFFASIIVVAVVVNWIAERIVERVFTSFGDIIVCMTVGLILAVLVYLDMYAKFYDRKKTR